MENDKPVSCSFCNNPARYMGDGQDGDFYCEQHLDKSWNGVIDMKGWS